MSPEMKAFKNLSRFAEDVISSCERFPGEMQELRDSLGMHVPDEEVTVGHARRLVAFVEDMQHAVPIPAMFKFQVRK